MIVIRLCFQRTPSTSDSLHFGYPYWRYCRTSPRFDGVFAPPRESTRTSQLMCVVRGSLSLVAGTLPFSVRIPVSDDHHVRLFLVF